MDFIETDAELKDLSSKLMELARLYYETRRDFGKAKKELFILLVPFQNDSKYSRAAIEKQITMMIADSPDENKEALSTMYGDYILLEQKYKGLEKLIEAYEAKISSLQSLLKWQRDNT
jgi:hypothetical protein